MNVVPPGSVAFEATITVDHSFPDESLVFRAVGATFVHVPVANTGADSFPNVSLTFARNHTDAGSFCVPIEKLLLDCRPLRVLPL